MLSFDRVKEVLYRLLFLENRKSDAIWDGPTKFRMENMFRAVIITALMSCVVALSGCSDAYPRLPDLTRMDNLLTPKQRDEAIKDLHSGEQPAQAPAATVPEGNQ